MCIENLEFIGGPPSAKYHYALLVLCFCSHLFVAVLWRYCTAVQYEVPGTLPACLVVLVRFTKVH